MSIKEAKIWKNVGGELHREDGPAVEYADGTKHWYVDGKRHREDGPAVEYANGDKYWYVDNLYYTFQEYLNHSDICPRFKERAILNMGKYL